MRSFCNKKIAKKHDPKNARIAFIHAGMTGVPIISKQQKNRFPTGNLRLCKKSVLRGVHIRFRLK